MTKGKDAKSKKDIDLMWSILLNKNYLSRLEEKERERLIAVDEISKKVGKEILREMKCILDKTEFIFFQKYFKRLQRRSNYEEGEWTHYHAFLADSLQGELQEWQRYGPVRNHRMIERIMRKLNIPKEW